MIFDKQLTFSDAQAVTAQAVSTNVVDLKLAGYDLGSGENLYLVVQVDTTFDDTGDNSTLTVELVTDDADTMGTPTVVQTLGSFAANAAAGSRIIARIQPSSAYERYIAIRYTPVNGDLSAGAVTAFIAHDVDTYKAYADGFKIS